MMSEKKNKYSTPESVAIGELKRASKENMNLVRYCSLDFLFVYICRKEKYWYTVVCFTLFLWAIQLCLFLSPFMYVDGQNKRMWSARRI